MAYPFGPKTVFYGITLPRNAYTVAGKITNMAGAIGVFTRVWADKYTITGSITGTALTLASAVPNGVTLGAGTKVAGTGVTAGTTIVSGSGTAYVVSASQTVASTALTFTNATTTGKIDITQLNPPSVDGTTNVYVGDLRAQITYSAAFVPLDATVMNVPANLSHHTFIPTVATQAGTSLLSFPWPWPTAFLQFHVDNTDVTNSQTCINVECWPVYGFNSDPNTMLAPSMSTLVP